MQIPCRAFDSGRAPSRRIAIVGAGGGIGRALVSRFRNEDAALMLTANGSWDALADASAAAVASGDFASIRLFRCDLANPAETTRLADAMVAAAAESSSGLDAFAYAAGLDLSSQESKSTPFDARFARAWQIDVASCATLARAIGCAMRDAARDDYPAPTILLFGWDGAERGLEGETGAIYGACKSAVAGFARALAQTLAPRVRVNVLAPGWVETRWGTNAPSEWKRRGANDSMLGRWADPTEIADVAKFLMTDASSFVNGQTIVANGGFSTRDRSVEQDAP